MGSCFSKKKMPDLDVVTDVCNTETKIIIVTDHNDVNMERAITDAYNKEISRRLETLSSLNI